MELRHDADPETLATPPGGWSPPVWKRSGSPPTTVAAIAPTARLSGAHVHRSTAESVRLFEAAQERFAELDLDAIVIGGANVFGADTLNEHVVQGLATARALA